jgi:hypothetical protein
VKGAMRSCMQAQPGLLVAACDGFFWAVKWGLRAQLAEVADSGNESSSELARRA